MNQKAVFLKYVYRGLSVCLLLCLCACGLEDKQVGANAAKTATTLQYAKRFGIQQFADYTLVSVFGNRENFDTTACFVLHKKSSAPATHYRNQTLLQVPCKRIVSLSCIYSAMLAQVGAGDAMVGIDNSDYVNDSSVLRLIASKKLAEVGKGPLPDLEAILGLQPDLVLMFGMGNPQRDIPKGFTESNLPTVIVLDHLEEHPLARAEWIKFFAAFADKQVQADSIFNAVTKNYLQLKAEAQKLPEHPRVFSEIKFGEAWYMPGGNSFMATLISDAGGNYVWREVKQSGSLPLSFEQVLAKAGNAEVWLNQPLMFSIKDILAADSRYAAFKAIQTKQVFNNCLHRNKKGYSPYWESGMIHPDFILADLIKIFHPKQATTHDYYFYEQLQ